MAESPIRGRGVTVEHLFVEHTFKLDYYQREYSWTREDVNALVSDMRRHFTINRKDTDEREHARRYPPYFLGSIVYYEDDDVSYLVDGQQRITTLLLLLIHLRRLLLEQDLADDATDVEKLIWSRRRDGRFRLHMPELNNVLKALLAGSTYEPPPDATPSMRNLFQRGMDLADDFPADLCGDALAPFVSWLTDRVCLVEVCALDREHGWEIFETTNDRGQRPGPVDLLKSMLLARAEFGQEGLNRAWRRMLADLSALDPRAPSDFIKAVLVARYAQPQDEEELRRIESAFHEWVRDKAEDRMGLRLASDFRDFIEKDLVHLGRRYCTLRAAASTWDDRYASVYFNEYNDVPHHLTAVMASLRPGETDGLFQHKSALVAGYLDLLFVRRLVNVNLTAADDLESDVLDLIPRLRRCTDITSLKQTIGQAVSQIDDEFGGMTTFGLRPGNRAGVRYVLARLTGFVEAECGRANHIDEYLDRSRPHDIEHIWANKFARYQGEVKTESKFNSLRNRLGALVLLPRLDNSSLGDDPYRDKLEHYQRQSLLAASLHRNTHSRNPGFTKFLKRHELAKLFRAFDDFDQAAIGVRQELYQRLCELAWSPSALGVVVPSTTPSRSRPTSRTRRYYGVKVRELVEAGVVVAGSPLVGIHKGAEYRAQVVSSGMIQLETGETFTDPSPAGAFVLNTKACSGWDFWHVVDRGRQRSLREIRNDALKQGLLERPQGSRGGGDRGRTSGSQTGVAGDRAGGGGSRAEGGSSEGDGGRVERGGGRGRRGRGRRRRSAGG